MKRVTVIAIALIAAPLPGLAKQDLLDVYDLAVRNDPQLASARAATTAADARYRQARGQLLPQLSGNASFSKVKQEQRFEGGSGSGAGSGGGLTGGSNNDDNGEFQDQHALTLNLDQTLFDWSAWQGKDAAVIRANRAESQLSSAASDLIVRTARRYFDVLSARAARQAANRQAEVIEKQLDRAKAAYESGLGPITDLQQARSELDSVRADRISAENNLANSRNALSQLTGTQHPELVTASPPFKATPPQAEEADKWVQSALENNPQLAAQRKALAAAREDVSQARGGHFPTVSLTGQYGEDERPAGFPGFDRTVTDTTSVGIEVSVPIFSGGTTTAAVDEARATAIQTRQDLIQTRRQIKIDTRTAFRDLRATAERVRALDQAIRSGETAVEAAKAGLRNGTRNILDVLEAEIELIQRRVDRKNAWYDYIVAGLRLKQQAGQLTEQDLRQVNTQLNHAPDIEPSSSG